MKIKKIMSLALVFMLTLTLLNNQAVYADSGKVDAIQTTEAEEAAAITDAVTTEVVAKLAAETFADVIPTTETPAVEMPLTETPAEETPATEVPSVETPSSETPAKESPSVETPSAELPPVETPSAELPSVETPSAELPSVELPGIGDSTGGGNASTTDDGMMPTPDPGAGSDVGTVIPSQDEADAPILNVMPLKTIAKGSKFEPLKGVYALDNIDGDLTSKIVVESNNVNVNTVNISDTWAGTPYEVVYSVTNSLNKTTRVTAYVYVYDASYIGALSVSTTNFSVVQNENAMAKIRDNVVVRDIDGSIADPADYEIAVNGNIYTGGAGVLNVSVVVESLEYGTFTEETLTITVVKSLTLNVSDYSVYRSDTAAFDPLKRVDAYQTNADGSTTKLGAYNVTTDTGVSVIGVVDITTIGQYSLTYSAKNSMGIVDVKTVTVSVVSEDGFPTVTAADKKVEVGTSLNDAAIKSWATASDPVDGDNLPVQYTVAEGAIDTSKVGTYNITYSYTNSAGNTATASIKLEVVKKAAAAKSDAKNNNKTTVTKTTAAKTASSAKTGDTSNAAMLMLALMLSALMIAGVVYISRKRKGNKA